MCGSEYFNGRLVNKKDRIKIHGHDRSPKKGTCQVFKFFLQIDSHFFQSAKVISSDEQYNCYNISFDKNFTPAHCSLEAAVTKYSIYTKHCTSVKQNPTLQPCQEYCTYKQVPHREEYLLLKYLTNLCNFIHSKTVRSNRPLKST